MNAKTRLCKAAICFVVTAAAIAASCRRSEQADAPKGANDGQKTEPVARAIDTASERAPTGVAQPEVPGHPVAPEVTPSGGEPLAGDSRRHETETVDGTYLIVFSTSTDPIPLNRLFSMEVEVRDLQDPGKVLSDITLAADAAMPHHGHGMNTSPKVRQTAEGRFTVTGMQFHMPGYWEVYFDVTHEGVTERAYVAIER